MRVAPSLHVFLKVIEWSVKVRRHVQNGALQRAGLARPRLGVWSYRSDQAGDWQSVLSNHDLYTRRSLLNKLGEARLCLGYGNGHRDLRVAHTHCQPKK